MGSARARRASFFWATAVLWVGGLAAVLPGTVAAQNLGGGGIVITGVDLSGQWDFEMTVLSSSDPAMIGRTFQGTFTVTGGVPTYSGTGTFNGIPATVSGSGAVDPANPTTITLSDHIATTDSETHFTVTWMSGDFRTGTFRGGTLDGGTTWDGVFKIAISRTPTQTPAERIESAFLTANGSVHDTVEVSREAIRDAALDAVSLTEGLSDRRELLRVIAEAMTTMRHMRLAAFRELESVLREFRESVESIVRSADPEEQPILRLLAQREASDLSRAIGSGKAGLNQEERKGHLLLDGRKPREPLGPPGPHGEPPFDPHDKDDRPPLGPPEPPVRIRDAGQSTYEYELNTGKTKVKLGRGLQGITFVHTFEVIWKKGPDDCPNKISQLKKRTRKVTYADGHVRTDNDPPPKGQTGTEYVEDTGPGGKTAQERSKDREDGNKSYVDFPGVSGERGATKVEYVSDYKIRILDCHDQEIECWEFKVTVIVEVQKDGKFSATTNQMTPPKRCE